MLIKFNTLLAAFSLSRVAALPSPVLEIRASTYTDPPYSVSTAQLAASLTCPRGVEGKAGGVVLLVHGTGESEHRRGWTCGPWVSRSHHVSVYYLGSTGPETWEKGPYNTILPTYGAGENNMRLIYIFRPSLFFDKRVRHLLGDAPRQITG